MLSGLLGLPGYPEAWSSTALWLPGGLVTLLDSPATPAVVSTGACWLLGCLISLLERLSASQSGSSGCLAPQQFRGFLFFAVWPLGQCGLLGLPACRVVSPPLPFDSLATRNGWSGGAAWLPGGLQSPISLADWFPLFPRFRGGRGGRFPQIPI